LRALTAGRLRQDTSECFRSGSMQVARRARQVPGPAHLRNSVTGLACFAWVAFAVGELGTAHPDPSSATTGAAEVGATT
jgi:hypothetical protein